MQKHQLFIITVALLLSSVVHSQNLVMYKNERNSVITQGQLDTLIKKINKGMASMKMDARARIRGQQQVGDTLFYLYSLEILDSANRAAQVQRDRFVNNPLPSFSYPDLDGKIIKSDDLLGKPVVINLWFTSCIPCINEMPELNRMKNKYRDSGVVFLSITYESKEAVRKFLTKHNFQFRHIPDAKEFCSPITELYPVNIFVDKKGMVVQILGGIPEIQDANGKRSGKMDSSEFEYLIASIIH